jgi:hypothetical protein
LTCFGEKIVRRRNFRSQTLCPGTEIPKGALVFNGTDEDDFLYCLPDNKEISIYRKIDKSMGFSKFEAGLSAMSKDDLADSLAYNSLKVQNL